MRKDEVRGLDHWIGGSPVAPGDGAYFESLNPIDDSLYSRAAAGTPADVDRAVEAADTAYRRNRDLSAAAREGWMIRPPARYRVVPSQIGVCAGAVRPGAEAPGPRGQRRRH